MLKMAHVPRMDDVEAAMALHDPPTRLASQSSPCEQFTTAQNLGLQSITGFHVSPVIDEPPAEGAKIPHPAPDHTISPQ
jgi:hypothetical protein